MLVLSHVLIALASVICSTYVFIAPSVKALKAAQTLVGLTVVTGTYLVLSMSSNMVRSCVTGLVYIAFVSVALYAAQLKLAHSTQEQ